MPRLDRFEGDGYRRIVTSVTLDDGEVVDAWVYEAIAED
ncbi:MAG: gamma-glutamylcyclotransferase [Acidimicrobiia bacterium]